MGNPRRAFCARMNGEAARHAGMGWRAALSPTSFMPRAMWGPSLASTTAVLSILLAAPVAAAGLFESDELWFWVGGSPNAGAVPFDARIDSSSFAPWAYGKYTWVLNVTFTNLDDVEHRAPEIYVELSPPEWRNPETGEPYPSRLRLYPVPVTQPPPATSNYLMAPGETHTYSYGLGQNGCCLDAWMPDSIASISFGAVATCWSPEVVNASLGTEMQRHAGGPQAWDKVLSGRASGPQGPLPYCFSVPNCLSPSFEPIPYPVVPTSQATLEARIERTVAGNITQEGWRFRLIANITATPGITVAWSEDNTTIPASLSTRSLVWAAEGTCKLPFKPTLERELWPSFGRCIEETALSTTYHFVAFFSPDTIQHASTTPERVREAICPQEQEPNPASQSSSPPSENETAPQSEASNDPPRESEPMPDRSPTEREGELQKQVEDLQRQLDEAGNQTGRGTPGFEPLAAMAALAVAVHSRRRMEKG